MNTEPLEILDQEHRVIETLLDALDATCVAFPPWHLIDDILEMLVQFADEEHHAKEEDILFPALQHTGLGDRGPVACMLQEHDHGREFVAAMREAVARSDEVAFHDCARQYTRLLRDHISKEDMILFPLFRQRAGATLVREVAGRLPSGPGERARIRAAEEKAADLLRQAVQAGQATPGRA